MDKEAETKQEVSNHTVHTQQKMNKEPEPDQAQAQAQPQEKQTNSDPSSPLALPSPSPSPPIPTNHSSTPQWPPSYPSSVSSLSSHGTSPIHELKHSSTPPENPPSSKQPRSPVALANRTYRTEPVVVTKVDAGAQDDFVDVKEVEDGNFNSRGGSDAGVGVGVGAGSNRRLRPNLSILRRKRRERMMKRSLLVFRLCGFAFCLISFSVMAADKGKGWALDSSYRYKEFRYCMAVNAIGFAYSGLQAFDLVDYFTTGKHIFRHHLRSYIDFSMDQMLTYLLISASSSAATRVYDWISNWGQDKFPEMASASVGFSFIAFVAFAFSSLISGYTLCKPS